jgi:hypothetical protein
LGVIGILPRDTVCLLSQTDAGIVAKPEDEAVERFLEKIVVVQKLLKLLVLNTVRWIAADDTISQEDRNRRTSIERTDDIQLPVGQLELEAVDGESPVADMPGGFQFAFDQRVVERRGTQAGRRIVAVL